MTIRTVEISPAITAQGDLLDDKPDADGNHSVLCEGRVRKGKLIECVRPCTKDGRVYE